MKEGREGREGKKEREKRDRMGQQSRDRRCCGAVVQSSDFAARTVRWSGFKTQ